MQGLGSDQTTWIMPTRRISPESSLAGSKECYLHNLKGKEKAVGPEVDTTSRVGEHRKEAGIVCIHGGEESRG